MQLLYIYCFFLLYCTSWKCRIEVEKKSVNLPHCWFFWETNIQWNISLCAVSCKFLLLLWVYHAEGLPARVGLLCVLSTVCSASSSTFSAPSGWPRSSPSLLCCAWVNSFPCTVATSGAFHSILRVFFLPVSPPFHLQCLLWRFLYCKSTGNYCSAFVYLEVFLVCSLGRIFLLDLGSSLADVISLSSVSVFLLRNFQFSCHSFTRHKVLHFWLLSRCSF